VSSAVECRLPEWHTLLVPGVQLTPGDRALLDRMSDQHLFLLETREGVRVETRGHVGVVQLESLRICIEPRLIGGSLNLVRLIDFTRRVDLMRRLRGDAGVELEGDDLFELVVRLFAGACDEILNVGVVADYVPQHDDLPVLRGRLDVRAQMLRRWGQVDRLVCDYEERLRDVAENRWLLRALRVARRGVRSDGLSRTVARLQATWEEFCDDDPGVEDERPVPTRSNHHYARALELAYLIVSGVGVSDVLRFGARQSFAFLLSMPRLFEEFIACWLERQQAGTPLRISRQSSTGSVLWDPDARRSFGHVRPDVMLTAPGLSLRLPIDAKYKDYDRRKLGPADVYQAAIYAMALASAPGPGPRPCLLFYPASASAGGSSPQRVQVRTPDGTLAEVTAMGVPVSEIVAGKAVSLPLAELLGRYRRGAA
jgi:5-methylcytosine-specific restriction enzyme subunit McrC